MAMHRLGNALAPRFLAIGVGLMHRLYNPKDPETLRVMEEAKELLGIKEVPKIFQDTKSPPKK